MWKENCTREKYFRVEGVFYGATMMSGDARHENKTNAHQVGGVQGLLVETEIDAGVEDAAEKGVETIDEDMAVIETIGGDGAEIVETIGGETVTTVHDLEETVMVAITTEVVVAEAFEVRLHEVAEDFEVASVLLDEVALPLGVDRHLQEGAEVHQDVADRRGVMAGSHQIPLEVAVEVPSMDREEDSICLHVDVEDSGQGQVGLQEVEEGLQEAEEDSGALLVSGNRHGGEETCHQVHRRQMHQTTVRRASIIETINTIHKTLLQAHQVLQEGRPVSSLLDKDIMFSLPLLQLPLRMLETALQDDLSINFHQAFLQILIPLKCPACNPCFRLRQ